MLYDKEKETLKMIDIDTVGYDGLGEFFEFNTNNEFYLLAPPYYYSFYSIYLKRCFSVYDGWVGGWHNTKSGLVPQRALQSVVRGLTDILVAHGIDFKAQDPKTYNFMTNWSKATKFYTAIKKGVSYALAGGTALLALNRKGKTLYMTAHRLDTFFPDVDGMGNITSVKIYSACVTRVNGQDKKEEYGICEERYFNSNNQPCTKATVYRAGGNLQTQVVERPNKPEEVSWNSLPPEVRKYVNEFYPSVRIGKEQLLPYKNHLGCVLIKGNEGIPQLPNMPFGQPIGDILFTESFQYDQLKYFEKNEVDLARARALLPAEMWNPDDPDQDSRALQERFFQKVSTASDDQDKITPIQFMLRGNDMKTQKENILKDIAFKMQVSASTIATFLSEGAGARTATEINTEKTKTDNWVNAQVRLNEEAINELLHLVCAYETIPFVDIVFKSADQSPTLDKLKIYSDVFSAGNMTPELFVKETQKNLSIEEQNREIENLKLQKQLAQQQQVATMNAWNKNA